jgi:hypothetical protein
MDTLVTTWEMNLEPSQLPITHEGLATDPLEPYTLDREGINWN